MRYNTIPLLGLCAIVCILSLSSCGAAKMAKYMDAHDAIFQNAITGSLSSEDKLDVVATSFVTALEEALTYSSTRNSVRHIDRFTKANEKSLNILIKDIDGWMTGMSPPDKIMAFGNLASKPYTKQLIDLVPKFEKKVNRKMRTFKIASKIIGLVKPKLF